MAFVFLSSCSISVVVITPYLPAGGPGFEPRIGHFYQKGTLIASIQDGG